MTAPGGLPLPPGVNVIGCVHARLFVSNTGVSTQRHLTAELPYPAIIGNVLMIANGAGLNTPGAYWQLTLLKDPTGTSTDDTGGTAFGTVVKKGAAPPDTTNEQLLPYFTLADLTWFTLPTFIPVPGSGYRVAATYKQVVAGTTMALIYLVVYLLDRPVPDPSASIVPRGTPTEPVCVTICPPTTPPAGPPAKPKPPPPPVTGPPTVGPLDYLADPLPMPCAVPPENPLAAAAAICQTP